MKPNIQFPKWSFWRWCFVLLLMGGIYAMYLRLVEGAFHLKFSDTIFPWNLILALDVLCGITIAAGGLTLATAIYVLNLREHSPVVRPCLVLGFLGYVVAALGLMAEPGRVPFPRGSHWNAYAVSALFIVFIAALILEFAPELWEHFARHEPPQGLRSWNMAALLLAVVLVALCQTRLADSFGMIPDEASPLWSTPQLPFFFFISGVCGGLALVIFASWHMRFQGKSFLPGRVAGLGRVLAALLLFYLVFRLVDLADRGIPLFVWKNKTGNLLLTLEIALIFLPMILLLKPENLQNPRVVYLGSGLVLAEVITNRLNTCITSVEMATKRMYLPDWKEFLIAYSIVALGIAAFSIIAKRVPLFVER
ncbi:MAG TPA: hypothetical protein VMT53_08580 [Terriglobales bacterium]|nr:hypothetical protein [Terriglobales bacterium]